MPFAPEYVRCVLRENFEDAKTLILGPPLAADRAWVSEALAGLESANAKLRRGSASL
jgi:hypothetical protein